MENATKALIIAAEVLIGVMILSLAVYLFVTFGQTAKEVDERNAETQLLQFNEQYATYLGRKDLTIYDVISITNKAKENNQVYENNENDENYIVVNINGNINGAAQRDLQKKTEEQLNELILNEQTGITGNGLPKFTCTDIKYSEITRKVILIEFAIH